MVSFQFDFALSNHIRQDAVMPDHFDLSSEMYLIKLHTQNIAHIWAINDL